MLILLISTQKLYFSDDEAIFDVVIEEPVRKCHNVRAAVVVQSGRAFAPQREGLVFESQPRQT